MRTDLKFSHPLNLLIFESQARTHVEKKSKKHEKENKKNPLYKKKFVLSPSAFTIFLGLVVLILTYTTIERTHVMDKYSKLLWSQPFFLIIGLMLSVYRGLQLVRKTNFKHGTNDPRLARSLMRSYLQETYGNIDDKLSSLTLTSADILTDMLKDKITFICNSDCLRFHEIREKIEQFSLKKNYGTKYNIFLLHMKNTKLNFYPLKSALYRILYAERKKISETNWQL